MREWRCGTCWTSDHPSTALTYAMFTIAPPYCVAHNQLTKIGDQLLRPRNIGSHQSKFPSSHHETRKRQTKDTLCDLYNMYERLELRSPRMSSIPEIVSLDYDQSMWIPMSVYHELHSEQARKRNSLPQSSADAKAPFS